MLFTQCYKSYLNCTSEATGESEADVFVILLRFCCSGCVSGCGHPPAWHKCAAHVSHLLRLPECHNKENLLYPPTHHEWGLRWHSG